MSSKKILSIIAAAGLASTSIRPIPVLLDRNNKSDSNRLIDSHLEQMDNSLSKSNKLEFEQIDLFGNSNGYLFRAANIRFNKSTKKLEVISESDKNISSDKADNSYVISLYNRSGNIIKTETYKNIDSAYEIVRDFNGLGFNYGDLINIRSNDLNVWTQGIDLKKNYPRYGKGPSINISYEITENGLIKQDNKLNVNPVEISDNKICISGEAEANSLVNIWVNDKNYIMMSDSKGLYSLELSKTDKINENTNIIVFNKGNAVVNNKVKTSLSDNSNSTYLNKANTISILGSWGITYLVSDIIFNYSNNKIEISNPGFREFSKKADELAYIITLYNKNGDVIKSFKYKGKNTNIEVHKDLNGLSFNYGDYIRIQSYGLNMEMGNSQGKVKFNGLDNPDLLCEITKDGLKEVILSKIEGAAKSKISLDNSKLKVRKIYSYKTNIKNNLNKKLPVIIDNNLPAILDNNKTNTLSAEHYLDKIGKESEIIFNIQKKASVAKKGTTKIEDSDYILKQYEPLGLQALSKGKLSIYISGDIKGSARLYINNGSLVDIDEIIPVNKQTVIDLSESGILILDTENIFLEDEEDDISFNFTVKIDMMNTEYEKIPVFDNRKNIKLCDYATDNKNIFYSDVNNFENYGAVIISENIRICIPCIKEIKKALNIDKIIRNYNKIFLEMYKEEYFGDFLYITYNPSLVEKKPKANNLNKDIECDENKLSVYTTKVVIVDKQTNTVFHIISSSGEKGELTGLKAPKIPEGYHVVNITNENGQVLTGIPYKFANSDEIIIYNIEKNLSKIIMKIINGKNISRKIYFGNPGDEFIPDNIKIPIGHYLVGPDKIPDTFKEEDQTIIYNIIPNAINRIIASISVVSGEILVGSKVIAEGISGTRINIEEPKIPEGYYLVRVLFNDDEVSKAYRDQVIYKVPAKILSTDVHISYIVAKNNEFTDIYRNMLPVYQEDKNIQDQVINFEDDKDIEDKVVKEDNNLSSEIDGEVIIRIVDLNGNILEEAVYNGEVGLRVKPIAIPDEYKLVNISLNGNITPQEDIKYEIQENLETKNKTIIIYNVDSIK